jgi:hypothetical protein
MFFLVFFKFYNYITITIKFMHPVRCSFPAYSTSTHIPKSLNLNLPATAGKSFNVMKYNLCFLFVLFLILWSGCKKDCLDPTDPECANYDPCAGYEEADAQFKILLIPQRTQGWDCDGEEPRDLEFVVDTVFANSSAVYFRAEQADSEEEGISYEWKVGTDARTWTSRQFELRFAENAIGDIPITLIVEKADPHSCGGADFTRDTFTKVLHVIPVPDDVYTGGTWSPVFGVWEGHNLDDESDSFQIEIMPNWELHGFIGDCVYRWPDDIAINLTFFYVEDRTTCADLCGVGTLSGDRRELTFKYSYRADNGEWVYRTFVGEKLR